MLNEKHNNGPHWSHLQELEQKLTALEAKYLEILEQDAFWSHVWHRVTGKRGLEGEMNEKDRNEYYELLVQGRTRSCLN